MELAFLEEPEPSQCSTTRPLMGTFIPRACMARELQMRGCSAESLFQSQSQNRNQSLLAHPTHVGPGTSLWMQGDKGTHTAHLHTEQG